MKCILAIDIGNTRTKIAIFKAQQLERIWYFLNNEVDDQSEDLLAYLLAFDNIKVGWISVVSKANPEDWSIWDQLSADIHFIYIHNQYPFPIFLSYQTPHTLGIDRIIGVIGGMSLVSSLPILVIDMGTAITYDLLTSDKIYQGGGIAPGLGMRFRALHTFTDGLPMVSPHDNFSLIGNTTEQSIRSGVMYGLQAELQGTISAYRDHVDGDLSVILTGGDSIYFEKRVKYINFVEPHLVLQGIAHILARNT